MTLVQYQPDPRLDLVFARTEKGSGVFSHCGDKKRGQATFLTPSTDALAS